MTEAFFLMLTQTGKCLISAECLKASRIWPRKVTGINLTDYLLKLTFLRRQANSIAISLLSTYRGVAAEAS